MQRWMPFLGVALATVAACGQDLESREAGDATELTATAVGADITPTCITIQRGLSGAVADALIGTAGGVDGSVTRNYGSSNVLTAGGGMAGTRQGLLRFDVSAIPKGATVTSATATLYRLMYGGAPVRAHRVTAPWSEATVSWASFAGAFSPNVEATFPDTATTTADLTSLVQGWVNGSVENDGLLLERDLNSYTVFMSSEYQQATRPKLDVCYVNPTCTDGVKNGAETAADCGGDVCPRCAVGQACNTGGDCADGACSSGVCAAPTCFDGVQNGSETDVDCGGSACARCVACAACSAASDCTTGECTQGRCGYTRDLSVNWLSNCVGPGGGGVHVTAANMPAGNYLVTALGGGATVWNPSTQWWWQINCASFAPALRTPAGSYYASAAAAFAALPTTTATASFAGGTLDCYFSDSRCDDNQGAIQFRVQLACE